MTRPPRSKRVVAYIAPADRIPLLQKIMFGAGGTMDYFATGLTTSVLWMPYFNIGLGISPALLGMVLMILRGWDAFFDPVMGNISDNARTRWGRRRPFMAVGAVLTAGVSFFLWRLPPGLSETGQAVYLTIVGLIFYSCFSSWSMPYYGLQLELTPNYDERTRLAGWCALISKGSGFIGGWVLAFLTSSVFANPVTHESDLVHGVRSCSWVIAAAIFITGVLPAIFVKERYYESETSHQARDPFWQSIRESARCGPLWKIIGASFFMVFGQTVGGIIGQYLNIYLVNGGKLNHAFMVSGWISSATFFTGIISIPLWTWLGEKYDKKAVLVLLLVGGIVGQLMAGFCMIPGQPYWQMIPALFNSMVISAAWLILPSMKGDVADYDEIGSSRRREGALNAFYSWFIKAALTAGAGVGGLMLQMTGFNAKLPAQPPEVLRWMKFLYMGVPALLLGIGLLFLWWYPLNRARMAEIRSMLENRRGKL